MIALEPELVRRAVHGEKEAIARVLADIRPFVVRYCVARVGPRGGDLGSAEDIAQDVCLTVLRVLPRFRDRGRPFAAFVYGIAARKVAEATRAARRRASTPLESLDGRVDPTAGPEQLAEAAELVARLRRLLDQLTPGQREVVVLRVAVGLTAAEAAGVLGITPSGVRVAQHRALKKLRVHAADILAEVVHERVPG